MYPVNEGDTLSKVTYYDLVREDRPLQIRIHFVLQGSNAGKYVAYIYAPEIVFALQWAISTTEQSALRECLEKIQGLSRDEVIHSC